MMDNGGKLDSGGEDPIPSPTEFVLSNIRFNGIVNGCDRHRVESIYSPQFGKLAVIKGEDCSSSRIPTEGAQCTFKAYFTGEEWRAADVRILNSSPLQVERTKQDCILKGEGVLCEIHENSAWLWSDILGIIRVAKWDIPDAWHSLMCVKFDAFKFDCDDPSVAYMARKVTLKTDGYFRSKILYSSRRAVYEGNGIASIDDGKKVRIWDYSGTTNAPLRSAPKSLKAGCIVSILYYSTYIAKRPEFVSVFVTTNNEIFKNIADGPFHIEQNANDVSSEEHQKNTEGISIEDNAQKPENPAVSNTDLPNEERADESGDKTEVETAVKCDSDDPSSSSKKKADDLADVSKSSPSLHNSIHEEISEFGEEMLMETPTKYDSLSSDDSFSSESDLFDKDFLEKHQAEIEYQKLENAKPSEEELSKVIEPLIRSIVGPYMEQIIALQKEMVVLQRDIHQKLCDLCDNATLRATKTPDNTTISSSVDNEKNIVANSQQKESLVVKHEEESSLQQNQSKISAQQSEWKSAKEAIDSQISQIDESLSRLINGYKNDDHKFIHTEKALKELFNELLLCMDIGEHIVATENGCDLMQMISECVCGVSPSMQQAQSSQAKPATSAPLSAQSIMKLLCRIDGFLDMASRNCASLHETSKIYPYLRNFIDNEC